MDRDFSQITTLLNQNNDTPLISKYKQNGMGATQFFFCLLYNSLELCHAFLQCFHSETKDKQIASILVP